MEKHQQKKVKISIRRGVIGILVQRDRYLFIKRATQVVRGGYWCFPGGHVERGETSRQAVQRELQEELGIVVKPAKRLGAVRLVEHGYVLVVWLVTHLEGEIVPAPEEIAEVRWASAEEIRRTAMGLPSNVDVLRLLGEGEARAV